MDGSAMKIIVCQSVMTSHSLILNGKGFAIFEIIITWGLISGILVVLATMQMLSVSSSLDGLNKTQYILSMASHGECLQYRKHQTTESAMAKTREHCEKAMTRAQVNNDHVPYDRQDYKAEHKADRKHDTAQDKHQKTSTTEHTELSQDDSLIFYLRNNNRQHQQTMSVANHL